MDNGLAITMQAQGVPEVRDALKGVRRSVKARVLKMAVDYAIKPLVPATKAAAPSKFGTLKRSIISRVKKYTKGGDDKATVVALVGPESKFKEKVIGHAPFMGSRMGVERTNKPSKYAHLVEFGTRKHFIPAPGYGRKAQKAEAKSQGRWHMRTAVGPMPGWDHPGTKAHPFIHPTAERMQGTVVERFRERALTRVKIEYDRYIAKRKRFWSTDV